MFGETSILKRHLYFKTSQSKARFQTALHIIREEIFDDTDEEINAEAEINADPEILFTMGIARRRENARNDRRRLRGIRIPDQHISRRSDRSFRDMNELY